jgi:hypothetical protein
MKRQLMIRLAKSRAFLPVLMGGFALQFNLGGCDPEVRDAFLSGIQSSLTGLINAMITAIFTGLSSATTETTTTTVTPTITAMLDVVSWLA